MNKVPIWILLTAAALVLVMQVIPLNQSEISCDCGEAVTKIHTVQGAGGRSPLVGQTVTVSAVVVGDFQGKDGLNGFFVQEEDQDADSDPTTSEGVFVYDPGGPVDVEVGELVCVTGKVSEYKGLTELKDVSQVKVCGRTRLPRAASVTLPLKDEDALESVEGMRVTFPQTLTVSDTYSLGRYGEITLSNGRLMSPTEIAAPGEAALEVSEANNLNRILLDDGSSAQNPDSIIYPSPKLTASHSLRDGDMVKGLCGVMSEGYNSYRVEPTLTPTFLPTNPRTEAPAAVGGTLRVASFNVENYFNGDGCGSGFPTARGALSPREFEHQRDKLVKAIVGLKADIIGLEEIENDGYGPTSALHDLVVGLNAAAPIGTSYDYIHLQSDRLGTDQITCALVYRVQAVAPIGSAATLAPGKFPEMNRLPLAQTFVQKKTGAKFTVVVNHFKSKSSRGAYGPDSDQQDGQGCWNHNRTESAKDLASWLATDPTGSGDPDVLIIGDLNAYTHEDPITTLTAAGYTDLVSRFAGAPDYTYVYKGEAGCLDHALASASLMGQVTGTVVWHINADEPRVLGYTSAYKTPDQLTNLYRNDPYRSSDHDPLIVGLNLR